MSPSPATAHPPITAIILAGGRARRMGGEDKALQLLQGRPLLAHVIERIAPQVETLLLNSNRPAEHYRDFGLPVVADPLPGQPGPLAGLLAGLAHSETPLLLAVPCDTPRLPADLVARLYAALEAESADVSTPQAGGRLQAAVMLLRRENRATLEAFLAAGGRRVQEWLGQQRLAAAPFSDAAAFVNINTNKALRAFR